MDVTSTSFERQVLERSHELPVVVDFWAAWCGPCRMLGPVLEHEVAVREGKVALAKVDVDSNHDLALRYQVRGIPAVKAFRQGEVVAEFVGAQPPAAVAQFLDELTGPTASERIVAELRQSGELPEVMTALERGEQERAFEFLLAAILATEADERERLINLAVALFRELGDEHPLTVRYRRQVAASLY
jgi:putative thioredoxin